VKDAIGVGGRKKKSTIIKTQNNEKMFVDKTYKEEEGTIFGIKDCHLPIGTQLLLGRSSKTLLSF